MTKDIKYLGYNETEPDYEAMDGQLAVSLGLINEDGTMKPLTPPKVVGSVGYTPSGEMESIPARFIYLHKTVDYSHYIFYIPGVVRNPQQMPIVEGTLFRWIEESWFDESATFLDTNPGYDMTWLAGDIEVRSVTSMGNTLVVLTNTGMHYFLWKDGAYKYLGTHLPEANITFGLKGHGVAGNWFDLANGQAEDMPIVINIPQAGEQLSFADMELLNYDTRVAQITELVTANANKLIREESVEKNKFLFPFFIRYAYRMFDGNTIMHSVPILMITNSDYGICAELYIERTLHNLLSLQDAKIRAAVFDIDYSFNSSLDELKKWNDIVKSIDIFVSAPIVTYNQEGKVEGASYYKSSQKGFTVAKVRGIDATYTADYAKRYVTKTIMGDDNDDVFHYELTVPHHDEEYIYNQVRDCSNFYLLKSIEIDNLATNDRTVITPPEGFLKYITSLETLPDDDRSHDMLISQRGFIYNNHLNLGGVEVRLANPAPMEEAVNYTDNTEDNCTVYVYIREGGKTVVVKSSVSRIGQDAVMSDIQPTFSWFYYPNPNAYKAVVEFSYRDGLSIITKRYELLLKKHDFLNGAYYFDGWNPTFPAYTDVEPSASTNPVVPHLNRLYNSEIGNPFLFPAISTNTIGNGVILAMSAATKALSEGQFGQFPLYAFTTEGVWALEVGAQGGFVAKQPVSRDVLLDPDSICQTDSSVLFATQRGIVMLSGGKSLCISDALLTETPFDIGTLPHLSSQLSDEQDFTIRLFKEFLDGCRMLFDYSNQHVILFNPKREGENDAYYKYPYAYVLSLRSSNWGMMPCNLMMPLNSYPDARAVTQEYKLVEFGQQSGGEVSEVPGFLVTRPLKLGGPDILKSIHTVIQRGTFRRGDVKTILYGSRDLYNWHLVGSSNDHRLRHIRGTSYKYFRIVSLASFTPDKSLLGASIDMDARHTEKLR